MQALSHDPADKSASPEPADRPLRLFVAVPLDAAVRGQAVRLQGQLEGFLAAPGQSTGLRWTAAPTLHITLAFLGNVPASQCPALTEKLASLPVPRCTLSWETLGLVSHGKQGTLWLAARAVPEFARLQAEVVRVCRDFAEMKEGPFRPHCTLARLGKGCVLAPAQLRKGLARFVVERGLDIAPLDVRSFGLYQSILRSGGAEHVRLARFGDA